MRLNRRGLLAGGIAGAAMFMVALVGSPAWALTAEQAKAHVQATVNELVILLQTPGNAASRAPRLKQIMQARSNLPQVAQFSAGRVWREMSPQQQQQYVAAFADYIANTYAQRFSEYAGNPDIRMGRVIDAGQKGVLVETPIHQEGKPIAVEWLVSDRGGRVEIIDIIIEGVSMATTQREEIASMFQRRGQDVDALITGLQGG